MPVIECDPTEARERLETAGVDVEEGNTDYELWRARHLDATAVAYADKVVVQGNDPHRLAAMLRANANAGPGAGDADGRSADAASAASADAASADGGRGHNRAHCYFDGASRGNPGPAAVGWVIVSSDGIVADGNKRIGEATNNRAEYEALIAVLEVAREYAFDAVDLRGDAELIVKQVRGEWNTNDPGLRERRVRVRELLESFDDWSIEHVPREVNERADRLANEALDDA